MDWEGNDKRKQVCRPGRVLPKVGTVSLDFYNSILDQRYCLNAFPFKPFFFVFQAIIDVIHPTKSDESGEMADDEDDDDDDDDYVTESEEEVDVDGGEDEPFVVSDVTESPLQLEVQVC